MKKYMEPVTEIIEINWVDTITTSGIATDRYPAFGPDGKDGRG